MGYGIRVMKDGEVCRADESLWYQGSNVCLGEYRDLSITVTYNYVNLLREVLGGDGIRDFDGRNVKCAIPKLRYAIERLSGMDDAPWIERRKSMLRESIERYRSDQDPGAKKLLSFLEDDLREVEETKDSYWVETPSNVRKALEGILWMAEKAPDGATWEVC